MTKKKIAFPSVDISHMATLVDQLSHIEDDLLSTNADDQILALRLLHLLIRHNKSIVVGAVDKWEEENKRELPNKPKWHK